MSDRPQPVQPEDVHRHVFDQTNGVLGADDGRVPDRAGASAPPSRFGIPPLTSL